MAPLTWLDEAVRRNPHPVLVELPERFKDATLDGIVGESLRAASTSYLQDFWGVAPKGIAPLFVGRTGLYKTYAAAVIARHVSQLVETQWVTCPQHIGRLGLNRFDKATIQTIDHWCTVPFLVMDDFTVAKGFPTEVLHMVSSARFAALRPTLWTGNVGLDYEHISGVYGAMFARRLRDGSTGYLVVVD